MSNLLPLFALGGLATFMLAFPPKGTELQPKVGETWRIEGKVSGVDDVVNSIFWRDFRTAYASYSENKLEGLQVDSDGNFSFSLTYLTPPAPIKLGVAAQLGSARVDLTKAYKL